MDIGGTFTDLVLLNQRAATVMAAKVLTSYPDPSQGVLTGVPLLLDQWGVAPGAVVRVIHGTTLVTNALIERKGARTGLITTEGFRDSLEIGREGRYDIYDLFLQRPEPLVERRLRHEVAERLDVRGTVLVSLDQAHLRDVCRTLDGQDVEAVAIAFLHAYANPEHENAAARIVREMLPKAAVSLSHRVAAEFREYERTSTVVANAYVQNLAARYLGKLEIGLQELGLDAPLHIMLSNGGTCSATTAAEFPVRLVESGPCGGALAAAYWGQGPTDGEVLAFDMGGTTAKAVLSVGGRFPLAVGAEVARVHRFKKGSGLPLLVPVLDMIEIGAGGGSIAHLSTMGLPKVGPNSAGAEPGPACYGLGGRQPTVTDADLLLGLLNPDYFLGGTMRLDVAAAREAIAPLAEALDRDVEGAAWSIRQLVDENMASALRVYAAERGLDVRGYTLVATGGAGPLHACAVAQRLGIETVLVPPGAGVGSAFGLMLAPISFDFSRTFVSRLDEMSVDPVRRMLQEMEQEGRRIVAAAGVPDGEIRIERTADMRYVGQGHQIRVTLPTGPIHEQLLEEFQRDFDREYAQLYGRLCHGVSVEAVNWRVTVSGPRPEVADVQIVHQSSTQTPEPQGEPRPVLFSPESGPVETPVFNRYALDSGFEIEGPAIVEEAESTTVVPPGWSGEVSAASELKLRCVER